MNLMLYGTTFTERQRATPDAIGPHAGASVVGDLMDLPAAKSLRMHVRRQLDRCNCLPTDRTIIIEASRDQLGDWQVIFLSPFGARLHLALRLALEARLRQRLGYAPQCLHHDNGILIRLTDSTEPVLDLLDGLTPENLQELILPELAAELVTSVHQLGDRTLLPANLGRDLAVVPESVVPSGPPWRLELPSHQLQGG